MPRRLCRLRSFLPRLRRLRLQLRLKRRLLKQHLLLFPSLPLSRQPLLLLHQLQFQWLLQSLRLRLRRST